MCNHYYANIEIKFLLVLFLLSLCAQATLPFFTHLSLEKYRLTMLTMLT